MGQESAETLAARETARRVFTANSIFEAHRIAGGLVETRRASIGEETTRREPSSCFIAMLRSVQDAQCRADNSCMHLEQKLIRECLA